MSRRSPITLALLAVPGLLAAYLLAWPVPIDPVAWEAPVNPGYTGSFARNERLSLLEAVPLVGGVHAPEAMTTDREGNLYAATEEGIIVRFLPDGSSPHAWANTGGRPLGIAFDDLDVAADGRVYFSDASTKFYPPHHLSLAASLLEILEHAGTGRLLRYDPATRTTTVLLDGLVFANGVAISHDQRSVLVNETGSYRVLRVWIDGPRAGAHETLIDALPGFPDNITRGLDGRYWIAFASPRNALVDKLSGRPFIRKIIQRLPAAVRPAPIRYGHVIAVDDSGRVVADLQDPSGTFPMITSALEVPGHPYIGSLVAPTAARVRWSAPQ